jgi:SNF2 family DNA or RNA helicase
MVKKELPMLWLHQILAIEKAETLEDLALFLPMGTGKSRCIVEILRGKYNKNKKILRTLIVCPSAVCTNWRNEILKYSDIPASKIHVLEGSLVKRAETYESSEGIFITNTESFAYEKFSSTVIAHPPSICVIDESQRIKEQSAKRTKSLLKVSAAMQKLPIHHRYILSGTPVLNSELDLFSQYLFLDCGKTFGKNYYAFRGTYFEDKNAFMARQSYFPNFKVRRGATDAIKLLMAATMVTAKKEDCITLPPLLSIEREVALGGEQKKLYEEMKKDFIAFAESSVATATLAITKALRMAQILSGHLPLEDGSVYILKDNPRADTLAELIEEIAPSNKLIVWAVFHADFEVIRGILNKQKIKFAEVTGLIKDKATELDKFEKEEDCRVMLASQSAGGVGVNMIEASYMVYYSKNYSLEHNMQSESRNYRGGSNKHKSITRIDLVARNTLDDIILKALRDKKDLSTNILSLKNLL